MTKNSSPFKSILFVGNHLSQFGANVGTSEILAEKLRQENWNVLLTSHKKNKLFRLLDMLLTIFLKRESFAVAKIDVFSGLAFIWAYLSGRLLTLLHKPYILTLHGGNLPSFSAKYSRPVMRLLSGAKAVTAPSEYLVQKMEPYYTGIRLITNGIDYNKYQGFARPDNGSTLLWLRAFHGIYNPELCPKFLAKLKNQGLIVDMIMIGPDKGDGSLNKTIELAESLCVMDQIKIVPGIPKDEVPHALSQGDIFINSTNVDNIPVSLIEAMASGLPIVTTNVGGVPWLVEDGVDGLLVPPDDPDAMANAVKEILTHSEFAARLSANARKKAENYDWSNILPQWEQLFYETIQVSIS